jgi:hypothetical protein
MTAGTYRLKPCSAFIQFLLDGIATKENPRPSLADLARKTGKPLQTLKDYADKGLWDLRKRRELVDLCGIDIEKYLEYISIEIRTLSA